MEMTCNRCHQTVEAGSSYCPYCGLPQLVYSAEAVAEAATPTRWNEAVRDASSVAWRPALRAALALGIPAGILCAFLWPVGIFGLVLMGFIGAWAVSLYMRSQRPAWITLGAGARIGLATGIVGAWTAAATTGAALYAMRYWFHEGHIFDNFWNGVVSQQMNQQLTEQWAGAGADPQTLAALKSWLLSPGARATWVLAVIGFLSTASLLFAIAGGALGARLQVRRRRPKV